MEAFIAGQEPDKDCNGEDVAVAKLPYYLQRSFYTPKELEPVTAATDLSAQSGEGAESAAPGVDESEGDKSTAPPPAPPPPETSTMAPAPQPPPVTPPPSPPR